MSAGYHFYPKILSYLLLVQFRATVHPASTSCMNELISQDSFNKSKNHRRANFLVIIMVGRDDERINYSENEIGLAELNIQNGQLEAT